MTVDLPGTPEGAKAIRGLASTVVHSGSYLCHESRGSNWQRYATNLCYLCWPLISCLTWQPCVQKTTGKGRHARVTHPHLYLPRHAATLPAAHGYTLLSPSALLYPSCLTGLAGPRLMMCSPVQAVIGDVIVCRQGTKVWCQSARGWVGSWGPRICQQRPIQASRSAWPWWILQGALYSSQRLSLKAWMQPTFMELHCQPSCLIVSRGCSALG